MYSCLSKEPINFQWECLSHKLLCKVKKIWDDYEVKNQLYTFWKFIWQITLVLKLHFIIVGDIAGIKITDEWGEKGNSSWWCIKVQNVASDMD